MSISLYHKPQHHPITTVNGSGSADLTNWADTFNGANGSDDEDPKYAFKIVIDGTDYYVPCFTSV